MLNEDLRACRDAVSFDDNVNWKSSSILRCNWLKSLRLLDTGFEVAEVAQGRWGDGGSWRAHMQHKFFMKLILECMRKRFALEALKE